MLAELERQYGHVSAERAISGQGLVNLHRALIKIDIPDARESQFEAAEIAQLALRGDATCAEAASTTVAALCRVSAIGSRSLRSASASKPKVASALIWRGSRYS